MEKVNPKSVIRISHCRTTPRNPNDRFGLKAESNVDIFEKDLSGAMVSPDTARTSASAKDAGFSKDAHSSTVAALPLATECSLPRK